MSFSDRHRTAIAGSLLIGFCLLSVVDAGDACCKAEAARRALIPDPFAVKPEFWDDEDDGPWEAPKVSLSQLPAWYRLLRETRLGVEGAAPLLISGVLAAALLTTIVKPLVPSLGSLLGKQGNSLVDSIRGSILGLLVPFCSCGALPLAITLQKEGISASSIAAFVTAAQAAGIDSMFFTYGVFGAHVALLRLVAAGVLAFLVGMTLGTNEEASTKKEVSNGSCCGSNCGEKKAKPAKPGFVSFIHIFVSTAVELFSTVAPWVLVGVLVSAVASVYVPPTSMDAHEEALSKSIVSRALLFGMSLPMTICEHGIVSLADALRAIGFSAGTAVALVVVGPSTNAGTLLMLSRLSSRNVMVAATKMVLVTLVFGVALSYLADDFGTSILLEQAKADSRSAFEVPKWINENAVSLAGLFTVGAIIQSSSLLFRSTTSSC